MLYKHEAKFYHGLISLVSTAVLIFIGVVVCGAEPQIPLIFSCTIAALVALWLGHSWEEILEGMLSGIAQSLEAVMILLLIGVLIGAWIASGTVPTLIYYGLKIITPKYFLITAAFTCGLVSFAIGAWGTVGTVGLAFMSIGIALGVPSPIVVGSIITGSYLGEIISPLSDATNLTAAVVDCGSFDLMKRAMPIALVGFAISEVFYFIAGLRYGEGDASGVAENIAPLLDGLDSAFLISPVSLIPIIVMIACISIKFPAIPAVVAGIISGIIIAVTVQGMPFGDIFTIGFSGYVGHTSVALLDELLTAGGLESMMHAISIIIIAMAFGGLMQKTGQISAMIAPIVSHVKGCGGLTALTAISCVCMNMILPDQYLGISVPGQMYAEEYDRRGMSRVDLSRALLCGGAITSPLVPWNRCGIYCFGILGVATLSYLPYAFLGLLLPVLVIFVALADGVLRKKSKTSEVHPPPGLHALSACGPGGFLPLHPTLPRFPH